MDASKTSKPVSTPIDPNDDKWSIDDVVADTFSSYKPSKLDYGEPHPDPVVETSTLSSIESNEITYELSIPKRISEKGKLSALQLESIVYACQAHDKILPNDQRAGFLIGDGAGVGKGRTAAGLIFENYLKRRKKAIWISVSNDLKYDAERDFEDIGALSIDVWQLDKLKYGAIDGNINKTDDKCILEGVVFSTYSSLISSTRASVGKKYNTRLKQLVEWCGDNFDGVIVFDECHRAKNLIQLEINDEPAKTAQTVLDLQIQLPLARVVYASATGASEPRNMAYIVRLGLWGAGTPFCNFSDFLQTVEKRGVGAMEVVAMDLKLHGMYIARQLSFEGVSLKVEEVPISENFKQTYNESVDLWVEAKNKFDEASALFDNDDQATSLKGNMWAQYWSAHQRFFKYMCIASKVSCAKNETANRQLQLQVQFTGNDVDLVMLSQSFSQMDLTGIDHSLDERWNDDFVQEPVSNAECEFLDPSDADNIMQGEGQKRDSRNAYLWCEKKSVISQIEYEMWKYRFDHTFTPTEIQAHRPGRSDSR